MFAFNLRTIAYGSSKATFTCLAVHHQALTYQVRSFKESNKSSGWGVDTDTIEDQLLAHWKIECCLINHDKKFFSDFEFHVVWIVKTAINILLTYAGIYKLLNI